MLDNEAPRERSRDALLAEVRRRATRRRIYRRGAIAVAGLAMAVSVAVPLALANGGDTQSVKVIAPPTSEVPPTSAVPAPTTTTIPPSTTTTRVAPTTTLKPTTTTTARPATVIMANDPWGSPGKLKAGVAVASTVDGTCRAGDGRAYDCSASSDSTYYQCWADGAQPESQVACPVKFTTTVMLMNLTEPLPAKGPYQSTEDLIKVVLANGDKCEEIWGTSPATVSGVFMRFGCTTPAGSDYYASLPDMSGSVWTIQIAPSCPSSPSCTGPLTTEEVGQAWR